MIKTVDFASGIAAIHERIPEFSRFVSLLEPYGRMAHNVVPIPRPEQAYSPPEDTRGIDQGLRRLTLVWRHLGVSVVDFASANKPKFTVTGIAPAALLGAG